MTLHFEDVEALYARLTDPDRPRPFTFLAGTGVTATVVPGIDGMVELVRARLAGAPSAETELDAATDQLAPAALYQAAMRILAAYRGQDAVNEVIRAGVLKGYEGPRVDIRNFPALRESERDHPNWKLSPGLEALGRLLARFSDRLSPLLFTTNFDPLLEIAIERAGRTAQAFVCHDDTRFDALEPAVPTVVHLHGHWLRDDTLHVQSQLERARPKLAGSLVETLRSSTVVVVGYSGWGDIFAGVLDQMKDAAGVPPDLIWCFYERKSIDISTRYAALLERLKPWIGGRVTLVKGVDANIVLPEIEKRLGAPRAPAVTTPKIGKDPWSSAVLASTLWPDATTDALRTETARIVAACRAEVERTMNAADPWRDLQLPLRVLKYMVAILERDSFKPTDAEVALALVAPFVREAVLAQGLPALAAADMVMTESRAGAHGMRRAIEQEHRSRPNLVRKIVWHLSGGEHEQAAAVGWWLGHRALLRRAELCRSRRDNGEMSVALEEALSARTGVEKIDKTLRFDRILRVATRLFSDDGEIFGRSSERADRLKNDSYGSPVTRVHEPHVARWVNLASWLAIDVRSLGEIVVEHIGGLPPLVPAEVHEAFNQSIEWRFEPNRLELAGSCPHAGLAIALEEHAGMIDRLLGQLHSSDRDWPKHIATRASATGIEAAYRDGEPRYMRDHIRFELSASEVRELLIGEQLYGDAAVALRELYQNALDACRYREARHEYLRRTNKLPRELEGWQGQISFLQRTLEDGRVEIICEDNGVGMGMEELRGAFARAGRRFRDLAGYAAEEANWLALSPPIRLYPNSQFGIGVLSYFMLADTVELRTARFTPSGQYEAPLAVVIQGGGTLFHVERKEVDNRAGTMVKLTISKERFREKPVSIVDTLSKWLVVADFQTSARYESREIEWKPGQPRLEDDASPVPFSQENIQGWWVRGHGEVLADGIRVEEVECTDGTQLSSLRRHDARQVIVNLKESLRPKLSVDRRRILNLDLEYIDQALVDEVRAARDASWLDVRWVERLAYSWPRAADALAQLLIDQDALLPMGTAWQYMVHVRETGFAMDKAVLDYAWGVNSPRKPEDLARRMRETLYRHRHTVRSGAEPPPLHAALSSLAQNAERAPPLPSDVLVRRNIRANARPIGILSLAVELRADLETAVARALGAGLELPATLDAALLRGIRWTRREFDAFFPASKDGDRRFLPSEVVEPGRLIRFAVELGCGVGEAVARLAHLKHLGLLLPSVAPTWDAHVEPADLRALSREGNGQPPWLVDVSIPQVVFASRCLGEPFEATIRRMRKFEPLGLRLTFDPSVDTEVLARVERDLVLLSRDFNAKPPWWSGEISPWVYYLASGELRTTVREAYERLSSLASIVGVKVAPYEPSFDSLPTGPSYFEAIKIFPAARTKDPYWNFPFDVLQELEPLLDSTARARLEIAKLLDENSGRHAGTVIDLPTFRPDLVLDLRGKPADIWAKICDIAEQAPELSVIRPEAACPTSPADHKTRIVLSRDLDGAEPWLQGRVPEMHLALAAHINKETMEQTIARFETWAPFLGLERDIPPTGTLTGYVGLPGDD